MPDSINEIHSHADVWLDSQVFIRLQVPASRIPAFVEANGLVPLEQNMGQLNLPLPEQVAGLDWWRLEAELEESEQWSAYRIPPPLGAQPDEVDGTTAQAFYFPTIVVVPTEKGCVWLYLRALDL